MNFKAIRQIIDWILDYEDQSKIEPKGVIIYNQRRNDEYPTSKDDRTNVADNIIKKAEQMNICLIPSYVLFEAVVKTLEGSKANRAKVEQLYSRY